MGLRFGGCAVVCCALACGDDTASPDAGGGGATDGGGLDGGELCGNGDLDPGETCDPVSSCPTTCLDDGDECTAEMLTGATALCNVACESQPITACAHDDGCCPAGCERGTDSDCAAPGLPALVVADEAGGVGFWRNAHELTDRAPDVVIDDFGGEPLAVATSANRLVIATSGPDPIAVYDDAYALAPGATATHELPASAIGGTSPTRVLALEADAAGDLWMVAEITGDPRIVQIPAGATGSPAASAQFTHPFGQIAALAIAGPRLFGAQASGAGILGWNDPASRTGTVAAEDFVLAMENAVSLTSDGADLYALVPCRGACAMPENANLFVWRGASSTGAARAPDVHIVAPARSFAARVSVQHGALLVALTTASTVLVFPEARAVVADTEPVAIDTGDVEPRKLALDRSGNLYVMGQESVVVYENALTTPEIGVTLTMTSAPFDLTLVE
jgi:hypothetical protein